MSTRTRKAAVAKLDHRAVLEHYRKFRHDMTAGGASDRRVAELAIDRLYAQSSVQPPAMIWCQSFYQMLVMPSLLFGLLHSDIWELVAGELTADATDEEWDQYWKNVWPHIWANSGAPLFEGMRKSSRIESLYRQLQTSLIDQVRSEFGKAFHSGRMSNMQPKLKREMYRIFWARHSTNRTVDSIVSARIRDQVFELRDFVRQESPDWPWWNDIDEQALETQAHGEGVAGLFGALANRLGGEPIDQERQILHLPADLPWLATATLLLRSWPEHFRSQSADIDMWLDLVNNAGAIACFEGVAFICEKPTSFHLNDRARIHNAERPAITYADGFAEYGWDGVLVPKELIENPASITVESIESSQNVEIRRVMLERYGFDRYIRDAHVDSIQEDECGILYRRELRGDEPLVMVKVINATAEPDGTFKEYFLRVPPDVTTAREGIAWTFGVTQEEYAPVVQT